MGFGEGFPHLERKAKVRLCFLEDAEARTAAGFCSLTVPLEPHAADLSDVRLIGLPLASPLVISQSSHWLRTSEKDIFREMHRQPIHIS